MKQVFNGWALLFLLLCTSLVVVTVKAQVPQSYRQRLVSRTWSPTNIPEATFSFSTDSVFFRYNNPSLSVDASADAGYYFSETFDTVSNSSKVGVQELGTFLIMESTQGRAFAFRIVSIDTDTLKFWTNNHLWIWHSVE